VDTLFDRHGDSETTYDVFVAEINALIDDNMHLSFTRKVKDLNLATDDMVLLFRFCQRLVCYNDDDLSTGDIGGIFSDTIFRGITQALNYNDQELITRGLVKKNLVNEDDDDFFGDSEHFSLTSAAKNNLLEELHLKLRKNVMRKDGLIMASSITAKQMFYNSREAAQVRELATLLEGERFKAVQNRLIEKGLRDGFVCLFSGAPGTGKTETAYQLARESGRDLITVNITDIQSKWVGESEQNLKAVFNNYRDTVRGRERVPILLFNEADGVISRRLELGNTSRSIDQMMNSLQNIILEEMEKLSGILIATTNLSQNMDKAFERRFLYKIEFEKPDSPVRKAIWQSLIPVLSDGNAQTLASRFDFSGGQIENIARKSITDYVLSGVESSFEKIVIFCKEELMAKHNEKPIGFTVPFFPLRKARALIIFIVLDWIRYAISF
jgi:hypothetical protein